MGRPHSKTRCFDCYWDDTLQARIDQAAGNLRSVWVRDCFLGFYDEMRKRVPYQTSALRLNKHFPFFAKLDVTFDDPKQLTSQAMVSAFGADGLRRNVTPYGYLIHSGIVSPSSAEDMEWSIQDRRQALILERARGKWFEDSLRRFQTHLRSVSERYAKRGWVGKRARFVPRSVTTALRAACSFFSSLDGSVVQMQQLTQDHLDAFLANHSGYRDNVRALVRYINKTERLFKRLRIETIIQTPRPDMFLGRMRYDELVSGWLHPPDRHVKHALICLLMAVYAQTPQRVVKLRVSDLHRKRDGTYRITFGSLPIVLDRRIGALLDRYFTQREAIATIDDAKKNPYLFTGLRSRSHFTVAAVWCYLKPLDVRSDQLFATAIFRAYLTGMRHPRALAEALGLTIDTAVRYTDLLSMRLRDEVAKKAVNA